jgi:hypothetical protein
MFPLRHGEALAGEIPGARLLVLEGAGHGIDRTDWDAIAEAVLEHTGLAGSADQPSRARRGDEFGAARRS